MKNRKIYHKWEFLKKLEKLKQLWNKQSSRTDCPHRRMQKNVFGIYQHLARQDIIGANFHRNSFYISNNSKNCKQQQQKNISKNLHK